MIADHIFKCYRGIDHIIFAKLNILSEYAVYVE